MKFLLVLLLASACSQNTVRSEPSFFGTPTATVSSEPLVSWDTDESAERLARSEKTPFFPLSNQFESQVTKAYCGPTSATIVLNALRVRNPSVKKPKDEKLYRGPQTPFLKKFDPVFERYTQESFFNLQTDHIKTRNQVFGEPMIPDDPKSRDGGIQLRQLGEMLKTYDLNVAIHVVENDSENQKVKQEFIENFRKPAHFIIVNFKRKALGQEGGAHISPIGAYDSASDSVLLMDVNANDHPWVWVKLDTLIGAMRTLDTIENRGYLVVSEFN